MSAAEIAWRAKSHLRVVCDRIVAARRRDSQSADSIPPQYCPWDTDNRVVGAVLFSPDPFASGLLARQWQDSLVRRAEKLLLHQVTLFDLVDCDLGPEVDWSRDYKSGVVAPLSFADSIDYRSTAVTGDCKFVWEMNRHHHFVVLARAYRVTGDRRFSDELVAQLQSWIRANPFGFGINWRSPLELGIRLINWVWALSFIESSGVVTSEVRNLVSPVIYRHVWDISRKFSRYSSANNHLIGEAAGVFIACSYFPGFRGAARWCERARKILEAEIQNQTYPDGGSREQAMGYQLFVMEFLLLVGLAARRTGCDMSQAYWDRLWRMFRFVSAHREGGGRLTMYGDCDDGYVLDLSEPSLACDSLMDVGARVFADPELGASESPSERAFWLLGPESCRTQGISPLPKGTALRSWAFPDSGRYIIQAGSRGSEDSISVEFDCGELGFGSIAAHGHADALSFTLRIGGHSVLVDPGTYDYFSCPDWRDYFRSTEAHNTVTINGTNQSDIMGPFMWGRRATAECLRWEPSADGGLVIGRHDGYARRGINVSHERELRLSNGGTVIECRDRLRGIGAHRAKIMFHFAESCSVQFESATCCKVRVPSVSAIVHVDFSAPARLISASDQPGPGWVSDGYHRKRRAPCVCAEASWFAPFESCTRFSVVADSCGSATVE